MPRKVLVLFSAPFILLITLFAWRFLLYSGKGFLKGPRVSLIHHFDRAFVHHSQLTPHIQHITGEKLNNGWQFVANFGSVKVWRTFSNSGIIENTGQLKADGATLQLDPKIFYPGVLANHWDFKQNQVFITLPSDTNPGSIHFSLTYDTFEGLNPVPVRNELLKRAAWPPRKRAFEHWSAFPLQNSLLIRKLSPLSPELAIKRNGEILPQSEWMWQCDSQATLYRASPLVFFRMFAKSAVYESSVYLKEGFASFQIQAKGEMAGSQSPRLGVYLDERKIGTIEVKDTENSIYEIPQLVKEGTHRVKIVFQNDYFDAQTLEDRNVDLSAVSVVYKSAILIKNSSLNNRANYTADYSTTDWNFKSFYWDAIHELQTAQESSDPIVRKAVFREEMRDTFALGAFDEITFPVRVPENGRLRFGYGFRSPNNTTDAKLKITVHRAFHLPSSIFAAELSNTNGWKETVVDVSKYASQNVRLSFQTATESKDPFLIFVSNPFLYSQDSQNRSAKYLFLISFDALRRDHLGIYGYQRPTSPNIDAYARNSVVFDHALTAATWTLPSFSSLFTSLYPSFHGLTGIADILPDSLPTLPVILRDSGFETAAFVDSPFLHPLYGLNRGFNTFNYHISDVEERARLSMDWLQHTNQQNEFIFVHLISPHSPYLPPEKFLKRLGKIEAPSLSVREQEQIVNSKHCITPPAEQIKALEYLYDGEIVQLDDIFGRFISRLKKLGVYDQAMIILMSDHGEEFMEHNHFSHGQNPFGETARVPLIVKFPNQKFHGVRVSNPVQLIDVLPTVLEVFHLARPGKIQGVSLMRSIRTDSSERTLFVETSSGALGVIRGRYKYVYMNDVALRSNCGDYSPEQLYDLVTDPAEKRNIANERPEIVALLRAERQKYEEASAVFRSANLNSQSRKIQPDPTVQEQLRALGYIQ